MPTIYNNISGIRRRRFERRISRSPRRVTKRANTSYVEAKRNKRKTSNSDREKSKSMTKEEDALDEGNENTTSKSCNRMKVLNH